MKKLNKQNVITASIPGRANTGNKDDDWADEYDAAEHRSDWENIWANM
jgi:hypothetical protein